MAYTGGLVPAGDLKPGTRAYGPHCTVNVTGNLAVLSAGGSILAEVLLSTGEVTVASLDAFTPLTVTPTNVFLSPLAQIKKNWRTGVYEVKSLKGVRVAKPAAKPVKRAAKPAAPAKPVITPTPAVVAPIAASPKPVPAPERVETVGADPLAALERAPKVAVKPLARGYVRIGEVIAKADQYNRLKVALTVRRAGKPAHVLVTGPAGTAKTRLAEEFAKSEGLPFLKISGQSIRSTDDWFGRIAANPVTGKYEWTPSPFTALMDSKMEAVVLIDEVNRVESDRALNGLFGVLDGTGTHFIVDAGRKVTMPPGILVIATANIGPEFTGTIRMDGAVRDRLSRGIRMAYPPEAVEARLLVDLAGIDLDTANKYVRVANLQRVKRMDPVAYPSRSVISTRVLLDAANDMAIGGADAREALWGVLQGRFSPEDEPSLVTALDTQFAAPVATNEEEITEVDLIGL
jgi:MoxR-like ATPase